LVDKSTAIPPKEQKLQTADSKERNERYLLNNTTQEENWIYTHTTVTQHYIKEV
jgi:hypothetical protein